MLTVKQPWGPDAHEKLQILEKPKKRIFQNLSWVHLPTSLFWDTLFTFWAVLTQNGAFWFKIFCGGTFGIR